MYSSWIKKSNCMGRGSYFFSSEFFLITVSFSFHLCCARAWVLPAMSLWLNQVWLMCIWCLISLTLLYCNYNGCFKNTIHWTLWFQLVHFHIILWKIRLLMCTSLLINQQIKQSLVSKNRQKWNYYLNPFNPEAQVGTRADGFPPLHVSGFGDSMLSVLFSCGSKRIHFNHFLVHVLTQLWFLTGLSQLFLQVCPAKTSHPNKTIRTPRTFLFTTYKLASRNINQESECYHYPSFAYGKNKEHRLMTMHAYLVKQTQESGIVSFVSCSNHTLTYCYMLLLCPVYRMGESWIPTVSWNRTVF